MLFRETIKLSTSCRLSFNRWISQSTSLSEIVERVFCDNQESPFVKQIPINQPIYYYERGCQVVYPYFNVLQAFCLGEWIGKYVGEVYFKDRSRPPKSLQEEIINKGFIRVNKQIVKADYVMQSRDVLFHVLHFHENPILDLPFKTVHVDDDFVIVDKPPGIPMHTAGKYKYNSLIRMVREKYGPVFTFHRIDSVTSGLIVLVRKQEKVAEIQRQMISRQVKKEYVCEVAGNFPQDEITVNVPLARCFNKSGPVIVDKHSGSPSMTKFKKVKFNHSKGTSIIACFPLTGRTHQIRVHLQYLGFPIVNDFVYGSFAFGPHTGKNGDYGGLSDAEIFSNLYMHNDHRLAELREDSVDCIDEYDDFLQDYRTDEWVDYTHENRYNPELDSHCPECHSCSNEDKEPPARSKQFLHLHALRYKGIDWEFSTQLPFWAR